MEASIHRNGRSVFLGYFPDENAAAVTYNAYAERCDGAFAWLNESASNKLLTAVAIPEHSQYNGKK
jgi:hypothetical protein